MDVNANDVVAFVVELAVLVLLGVAGARLGSTTVTAVLLAVLLPLAAALLWALFAAPRARVESTRLRLLTKLVVLGAGVVAAFYVLPAVWAVVFALVALVNTVLMYVGPFARRPLGHPRSRPVS
jgi:hypothetical protein